MKITKDSRNLALFMIMGKGHINNGCLEIRHSKEQLEYLEWKKRILNKKGIATTDIFQIDDNTYCLKTFSHNFIRLYKRILYNKRKNIAKNKLLNKLDSLGLAILYMDIGHINLKRNNSKITGRVLTLNINTTKENNQIIIDYFKKEWNINFYQVKSRGFYNLRCGTKESEKYINIVKPYINKIKCMQYKLN